MSTLATPSQTWANLWDPESTVRYHIPGTQEEVRIRFTDTPLHPHFFVLCQQALDNGADINQVEGMPRRWATLYPALHICLDTILLDYIRGRAESPSPDIISLIKWLFERGAALDLMEHYKSLIEDYNIPRAKRLAARYIAIECERVVNMLVESCLKHVHEEHKQFKTLLIVLLDNGLPAKHQNFLDFYGLEPDGRLLENPIDSELENRKVSGSFLRDEVLPRFLVGKNVTLKRLSRMAVQKAVREKRMDPKLSAYLLQLTSQM